MPEIISKTKFMKDGKMKVNHNYLKIFFFRPVSQSLEC